MFKYTKRKKRILQNDIYILLIIYWFKNTVFKNLLNLNLNLFWRLINNLNFKYLRIKKFLYILISIFF